MDEHGNIFVTDRLKNIIKTKVRTRPSRSQCPVIETNEGYSIQGFQISPAELEGHLLKHPFVQDVGVIGKPDDRAGELPVAFVTLTPPGLRAMRDPELVKRSIKAHVKASKVRSKLISESVYPVLKRTVFRHSRNTSGSRTSLSWRRSPSCRLGRSLLAS